MASEERTPDIVEEALSSLRTSQVPQGPSAQALEETLRAVAQAQNKPDGVSIFERIRNMNKYVKYPLAACVLLAILAGMAYVLLFRHAEVAFADVRRQIEQAQSMSVKAEVVMKTADRNVTMHMQMYFKPPGLMRQEIRTEGLPGFPPSSTGPATRQAPTQPAGPGVAINIFDFPGQRGISLVPQCKLATVTNLKNTPPVIIKEIREHNLLQRLKDAVAGEHVELGERVIDGHKAKGYRCKEVKFDVTSIMDIWVDASTGAPLMTEMALPGDIGHMTMTDFVIDPPLADSMFDTAAPEGYKVQNMTVDFNMTEQDMAAAMGLIAKANGGEFPKSFMPSPELIKRLEGLKVSEAQGREIGIALARLMAFRTAFEAVGGKYEYAGAGVKLGDKAAPIVWYAAKADKTWTVIYGDLHIEKLPNPPKAPATRPS